MESNPKQIGIVIGISLASFALLFGIWKLTSKPVAPTVVDIKLTEKDHVLGKKDSKVVLVEYSDFQCPACKAYQPMIKQVIEKYKDKITFTYRHFPLPLHLNAVSAAQAAEAAALQNKFWEMHDMLFDTQTDWEGSKKPQDIFVKYATKLKLNVDTFKKDLQSSGVADRVTVDKDSGRQYGVDSTPTFFLNGVKLDSPQSFADFEKLIDAQLSK